MDEVLVPLMNAQECELSWNYGSMLRARVSDGEVVVTSCLCTATMSREVLALEGSVVGGSHSDKWARDAPRYPWRIDWWSSGHDVAVRAS